MLRLDNGREIATRSNDGAPPRVAKGSEPVLAIEHQLRDIAADVRRPCELAVPVHVKYATVLRRDPCAALTSRANRRHGCRYAHADQFADTGWWWKSPCPRDSPLSGERLDVRV